MMTDSARLQPSEQLISRFIDQCLARDTTSRVRASTLYEAFRLWCERQNQYQYSHHVFGREMTRRGFHRIRSSGLHYIGVRLLVAAATSSPDESQKK